MVNCPSGIVQLRKIGRAYCVPGVVLGKAEKLSGWEGTETLWELCRAWSHVPQLERGSVRPSPSPPGAKGQRGFQAKGDRRQVCGAVDF